MRAREIFQPGRRDRSSERGSALIVVLTLILALTALGVIGLRHTTFELRNARNLRLAKQAEYVSEGAMTRVVHQVGTNGQAYWEYINRLSRARDVATLGQGGAAQNSPTYAFKTEDVAPNGMMFMAPTANITSCQQAAVPADCQGLEVEGGYFQEARPADWLPRFTVTMRDPLDGPKAPGFSDSFCFKRFTFESRGEVGKLPGAADVLRYNQPSQGAVAEHWAQALVGPLDCQGYYR